METMYSVVVKRDPMDKYIHGDKDRAEKFIGFLKRSGQSQYSTIYREYKLWCKNMNQVPVSDPTFRALLKEHGFRIDTTTRYHNINVTYPYSKVAYIDQIKEVKNDKNKEIDDLLCTNTQELIEEPNCENLEFFPSNDNEETKAQEDYKQNSDDDSIDEDGLKLSQISIIEVLEKAEKIAFERKLKKLNDLKEEIIDNEYSNTELLNKLEEIVKSK